MKKVMIVDDEVLVRVGIKSLLNWEEHDYAIIGDASDGKDALEKIEKYVPDIVLTDLMMEPLDGFELMEECRRLKKNIKFIVLSNYNDFENVKKAMKMGAFDYVFKLTVKPEELLEIMNEACKCMEVWDQKSALDHRQVVHKNFDVIKTNLLNKLLGQSTLWNAERELQEISLKIDLHKKYRTLYIKIDNFSIIQMKGEFTDIHLLNFTMENITSELLNRICNCEVICYKECDLLAICNYEVERGEFIRLLKQQFSILAECIKKYIGVSISGAISEEYCGADLLKKAADENIASMENRFFRGRNLYDAANNITQYKSKEILREQLDEIEEYIIKGMFEECSRVLLEIAAYLEEGKEGNPQEIKYYLRKVYKKIYSGFIKRSVDIESICNKDGVNLEQAINGYDFYSDIKESIFVFLELYRKESEISGTWKSKKPCRKEILYVQNYIGTNLEEEISVSKVSAMVNMSESRFSHVFKEQIGVSFLEYVNQVKLEEASKMLKNTDMKINEIAEKVGIYNPNYFSAQFKKKTGLSPGEFRKSEWASPPSHYGQEHKVTRASNGLAVRFSTRFLPFHS